MQQFIAISKAPKAAKNGIEHLVLSLAVKNLRHQVWNIIAAQYLFGKTSERECWRRPVCPSEALERLSTSMSERTVVFSG